MKKRNKEIIGLSELSFLGGIFLIASSFRGGLNYPPLIVASESDC